MAGRYSHSRDGARSRIRSASCPNAGSPREFRMSRVKPTRNVFAMTGSTFASSRLAEDIESVREGALQHQRVDPEGQQPESLRGVVARPIVVGREECRRLAVCLARGDDALGRGYESRVLELPGNAQKIAEVEVPQPERVD